jgi:UPF0271 protein
VRVLLNVDLGELTDEPDELYAIADVANVACGGHAGDDASMAHALAECARRGASPGAHPSYPDRAGFGRKRMEMDGAALEREVFAQCARLAQHAQAAAPAPLSLRYVKPHGALYHAADGDAILAAAVVQGAKAALGEGVAIVGPAGGALAAAATRAGLPFLREGFADRGRRRAADGRWMLVPRGQPGAMIDDPQAAAAQALQLVAEGEVDTLCVHGDGANALAVARAVRAVLGR